MAFPESYLSGLTISPMGPGSDPVTTQQNQNISEKEGAALFKSVTLANLSTDAEATENFAGGSGNSDRYKSWADDPSTEVKIFDIRIPTNSTDFFHDRWSNRLDDLPSLSDFSPAYAAELIDTTFSLINSQSPQPMSVYAEEGLVLVGIFEQIFSSDENTKSEMLKTLEEEYGYRLLPPKDDGGLNTLFVYTLEKLKANNSGEPGQESKPRVEEIINVSIQSKIKDELDKNTEPGVVHIKNYIQQMTHNFADREGISLPGAKPSVIEHEVKSGDNMWDLAEHYATKELGSEATPEHTWNLAVHTVKANPEHDPLRLQENSKIKIPIGDIHAPPEQEHIDKYNEHHEAFLTTQNPLR